MELKDIVLAAVTQGVKVWSELKPNWRKYGLPGSAYSPAEFVTCLLLAKTLPSDLDLLAAEAKKGKDVYQWLVSQGIFPGYMSKDEMIAVFAAALVADIKNMIPQVADSTIQVQEVVKEPPAPEVVDLPSVMQVGEPLVHCPHCGHDFEKCAQGIYETEARIQKFEAQTQKEEIVKLNIKLKELFAAYEIAKQVGGPSVPVSGCVHVGLDGKCTECTEEDVIECSYCDSKIIESKAHKCKNFDNCGNAYCDADKDELNEYGYCSECDTIDCDGDGCGETMDTGTEKRCSNPRCSEDEVYCDECAAKLLNTQGLCSSCSGEEEEECSQCGKTVTESRFTRCANPDCDDENGYCPECTPDYLDEKGLCPECS